MFSPGTLLAGKYELLEIAGQGGMATVWKARMQGAGTYSRPLAIKVMLARLCHDPHFVDLFIEEARVSSQLQHPNVVQITDFGQDSGIYFLAMEWVDGLDLLDYARSFTEQGFLMPWAALATVSVEVLKGLQTAHQHVDERGLPSPIFHRDVTPHNVLIGTSGVVKLTDFGLAKATDRGTMTLPHVLKGKISYTAPEMTRGVKANARTDVFSLGVTFWEALVGRKMFDAGSPLQIVRQIQAWNVPPLVSLRPDLPSELIDVVEQAIARDPNQRFDSAQAMALALSRLLPPLPDLARLGKSVAQARERLWQAKNAPVEDFDKMREALKPMLPTGPTFSAPTAEGRAARAQPGAGARTPSSEAPPATPSVRVSRPAPVRISERSPAPAASTSGSLSVSVLFDEVAGSVMGGETTPPTAAATTPPAGGETTPPAGGATTPPRGAATARPVGTATTPPRGAPTAPPTGAATTPPTGAATTPPGARPEATRPGARPALTGATSQRHDALRPPPSQLPGGRAVDAAASSPAVDSSQTPVMPPPRMGSQPELGTAPARQGSRPDLGAYAMRPEAPSRANPAGQGAPGLTGFEDEPTRHGNSDPVPSSGSLSSRLGATRGPFYRPPTPAQGTPAVGPAGQPATPTPGTARTTTATGLGGAPARTTTGMGTTPTPPEVSARSTTGVGGAPSARTTTATGLGGAPAMGATPAPGGVTSARTTTATGMGGGPVSGAPSGRSTTGTGVTPSTPAVSARSTTAGGVTPTTPAVRPAVASGAPAGLPGRSTTAGGAAPVAPSARTTTATGIGGAPAGSAGSARTTTATGIGSTSGAPAGVPVVGAAPGAGGTRTTTATGVGGGPTSGAPTSGAPTSGATPAARTTTATGVGGAARTTTATGVGGSARTTTGMGTTPTPSGVSARSTTGAGAPAPGGMSNPGAGGSNPGAGGSNFGVGGSSSGAGGASSGVAGSAGGVGPVIGAPGAVRTTTGGAPRVGGQGVGSAPPGSLPAGGPPSSGTGRSTMRPRASSRPPEPSPLDISLEFDLGPSSPQWKVPTAGVPAIGDEGESVPSGGRSGPGGAPPARAPLGATPAPPRAAPIAPAAPVAPAGSSRTITGGGVAPKPAGVPRVAPAAPVGRPPAPAGAPRAAVPRAQTPEEEASSLVEIEDLLGSLPSHKDDK